MESQGAYTAMGDAPLLENQHGGSGQSGTQPAALAAGDEAGPRTLKQFVEELKQEAVDFFHRVQEPVFYIKNVVNIIFVIIGFITNPLFTHNFIKDYYVINASIVTKRLDGVPDGFSIGTCTVHYYEGLFIGNCVIILLYSVLCLSPFIHKWLDFSLHGVGPVYRKEPWVSSEIVWILLAMTMGYGIIKAEKSVDCGSNIQITGHEYAGTWGPFGWLIAGGTLYLIFVCCGRNQTYSSFLKEILLLTLLLGSGIMRFIVLAGNLSDGNIVDIFVFLNFFLILGQAAYKKYQEGQSGDKGSDAQA